MSTQRYDEEEKNAVSYPRCPVKPNHDYRKVYNRFQRGPLHPDEDGAVAVFDELHELRPPPRFALFPIDGDKDFLRVVSLPPPGTAPHAPGVERAEPEPKTQARKSTGRRIAREAHPGPLFRKAP